MTPAEAERLAMTDADLAAIRARKGTMTDHETKLTEGEAKKLAIEAVKAGKWTPRHGPFYTGLSEERIEKAVAALVLRVEEAAHARGREEGLTEAAEVARQVAARHRKLCQGTVSEVTHDYYTHCACGARDVADAIDRRRGGRGTT